MKKDSWIGKNLSKCLAFLALLLISTLMLIPLIWGVFGSLEIKIGRAHV